MGDVVCVMPEVRQLVRQENQLAASRSTAKIPSVASPSPNFGTKNIGTSVIRQRGVGEEGASSEANSSEGLQHKP